MMGGPTQVSNNTDRMGLSATSHELGRGGADSFQRHASSYRHPKNGNYSNNALNGGGGCQHGPQRSNSNGLNGSSLHSRNTFRNKSFTKPRTNSSNPVYDPLSGNSNHSTRSSSGSFLHSYKKPDLPQKSQYLAMDCEMVGTISGESVAARVVLIDWRGRTVLDIYVQPDVEVADYRTFVSGITKEHLDDATAHTFADAQKQVNELLEDKILVGHGVDNDLRSLGIAHPWLMTRDTAYYQPFMRLLETSTNHKTSVMSNDGTNTPVWGPRKLKELSKEKLQREIQIAGGSHCPVEDALAALDLYKSHRPRWEACMSSEERQQHQYAIQMAAARFVYEYDASLVTSSTSTTTTASSSSSSSSSPDSFTSPHYTFAMTPPPGSNYHSSLQLPPNELSMSMHSYSTYENHPLGGSSMHCQLDNNIHRHHHHAQPLRTLSNGFQSLSLLRNNAHSYHPNAASSSLDCRTYHGQPYASRPHFHRSTSLDDSPFSTPMSTPDVEINRKTFQRQSSYDYCVPHSVLQRQSSLAYAPPGLPSQSKFAFAREDPSPPPPPPPGYD